MNSEAFVAWTSLFSESLADVFVSEERELKKVAMIISALKVEFKKIENIVEEKFNDLKRKIPADVEESRNSKVQKSNRSSPVLTNRKFTAKDMYKKDESILKDSSAVDLFSPNTSTENSEGFDLSCSLNLMNPSLARNIKISSTPVRRRQKLEASFQRSRHLSQKKQNSILRDKYSPLIGTNLSERQQSFSEHSRNPKESKDGSGEKKKKSFNSETFLEKQIPYKTKPVRGKARMELPGWACRECEDFYEALELSPEAKRAKMNACSKHKSKFKPPPDTPKGFWDLTFPRTPDTEYS